MNKLDTLYEETKLKIEKASPCECGLRHKDSCSAYQAKQGFDMMLLEIIEAVRDDAEGMNGDEMKKYFDKIIDRSKAGLSSVDAILEDLIDELKQLRKDSDGKK